MGKVTPELIRAQAKDMRDADIGERRSAEIAADVGRLSDAVAGARSQPFSEATLFRTAHLYQRETDWHQRAPSL